MSTVAPYNRDLFTVALMGFTAGYTTANTKVRFNTLKTMQMELNIPQFVKRTVERRARAKRALFRLFKLMSCAHLSLLCFFVARILFSLFESLWIEFSTF